MSERECKRIECESTRRDLHSASGAIERLKNELQAASVRFNNLSEQLTVLKQRLASQGIVLDEVTGEPTPTIQSDPIPQPNREPDVIHSDPVPQPDPSADKIVMPHDGVDVEMSDEES